MDVDKLIDPALADGSGARDADINMEDEFWG
jgi:hypothetical protein